MLSVLASYLFSQLSYPQVQGLTVNDMHMKVETTAIGVLAPSSCPGPRASLGSPST